MNRTHNNSKSETTRIAQMEGKYAEIEIGGQSMNRREKGTKIDPHVVSK